MTAEPYVAIEIDSAAIEAFCRKWSIEELALFGSVLTDEFSANSDVDFLAVFREPQPDWGPCLARWRALEEELSAIVGTRVDLVSQKAREPSRNYLRRRHIPHHQRTV